MMDPSSAPIHLGTATLPGLSPAIEEFILFARLPEGIRHQVIEEATETRIRETRNGLKSWQVARAFIFEHAEVNQEWRDVIEKKLFSFIKIEPDDLTGFAQICSTRQRRLNTIRLSITNGDVPNDGSITPEVFLGNTIAQFLKIMRNWDPEDRQGRELLTVELNIAEDMKFNAANNLSALPPVPIIGALYELAESEHGSPNLHPLSSLGIYQSLPNARRVSLSLRYSGEADASLAMEHAVGKSTGLMRLDLILTPVTWK
jgi:hypothetical protein